MTAKRLQAAYDKVAAGYAVANAEMPQVVIAAADSFLNLLDPGARVLDLGCSAGRDMAWLEHRGAIVVGADLSTQMLAQAQHQTRGSLIQMDMRRPAYRAGCFQGAWCDAALLHAHRDSTPTRPARRFLPIGAERHRGRMGTEFTLWQIDRALLCPVQHGRDAGYARQQWVHRVGAHIQLRGLPLLAKLSGHSRPRGRVAG